MEGGSTASVFMAWKGKGDDARLFRSSSDDGARWMPQQLAGDNRGSSNRPALVAVQGLAGFAGWTLLMTWKGIADDYGLYWSLRDGGSWQAQRRANDAAGDFATSSSPSLAVVGRRPMMVWKGYRHFGSEARPAPAAAAVNPGQPVPDDPRLFWSIYDGSAWWDAQLVAGGSVGSSHGPAIAGFGANQAVLAWKGKGADQRLFWSLFDGHNWSRQGLIADVGSSDRPALAFFSGNAYMAWKGAGDDPQLYWSRLHEGSWDGQQLVQGGAFGTSHGPALAVVKGKLIMAWKGKGDDPRLFWSLFDGRSWSGQEAVAGGGVGTSDGPALASYQVFNL
jgi:hypothetical protein